MSQINLYMNSTINRQIEYTWPKSLRLSHVRQYFNKTNALIFKTLCAFAISQFAWIRSRRTMRGELSEDCREDVIALMRTSHRSPRPRRRIGAWCLDEVTCSGSTDARLVVCCFSKFVTFYPLKSAVTKICLDKIINHYFTHVGKPRKILSDNGTQFTAHAWRAILESLGIKVLLSSVRHPQSNPVERTMRELGRLFRIYCSHKHTAWTSHLNFVQDCLN